MWYLRTLINKFAVLVSIPNRDFDELQSICCECSTYKYLVSIPNRDFDELQSLFPKYDALNDDFKVSIPNRDFDELQ